MENRSFNSDSAKHWAELSKKSQREKLLLDCGKLIGWLKLVYEDEIKKAIDKNPSCRYAWIAVPKRYRVYKHKVDDIKEIIEAEFRCLGFSIKVNICHCPLGPVLCPLCGNKFTIKFSW